MNELEAIVQFLLREGVLLVALFYLVTFLVVLLQQPSAGNRLLSLFGNRSIGKGCAYAALAGAVTPFCSCSTVPVLSGMLRAGIKLGICFTFLIASPVINEGVVLIMLRQYDLAFALAFIAVAAVISIYAGLLVHRAKLDKFVKPLPNEHEIEGRIASATAGKAKPPYTVALRYAARSAALEVRLALPYLLSGLVVGAAIYGYVPVESVTALQASLTPPQQILALALLGVPLYINALIMVPIAVALIGKGVLLGPLVALLVSGAGTSVPELILLARLFYPQLVILHMLVIIAAAVGLGYAMHWLSGYLLLQ